MTDDVQLSEPIAAPAPVVEPAPESPAAPKRSLPNPWVLLIIGLVVGGLAGYSLRPLVAPPAQPVAEAAPLANVEPSAEINEGQPHQQVMMTVIANARHFYGDPNAPVTLVEFGDFNCGYCGKWAKETLPKIDQEYIKTGKVRMAYVHYPILGPDSMTAAEASECAALQDTAKFWAYHNVLYANQGIGFTKDHLIELAGQADLDKAEFETCLNNFSDRTKLEDDIRLSQVMGVRGTPAFLVNGIPLAGAYPYDDFVKVIEGTLAGQF